MRIVENTQARFELRHRPMLAATLAVGWTVIFAAGGLYALATGDFGTLLTMLAGVGLGLLAWRLLVRPLRLVADAQAGTLEVTERRQQRRWPLAEISGARLADTLMRSAGYTRIYWIAIDFTDGRRAEQIWPASSPTTARRYAETLDAWLQAHRG